MQYVKDEITFHQYYHKTFTFPEQTGKETFIRGNSESISYFERSYNYDDFEVMSENVDPVNSDNMWMKKPKPKQFNYKYSPRRENKYSPFRKQQNFSNRNIDGDEVQREQNQSENEDFRFVNKRYVKYKPKNKNNFKSDDSNVVCSVPQEKKLQ